MDFSFPHENITSGEIDARNCICFVQKKNFFNVEDVFPAFVAKIIQRPMKSFCAPTVKKILEFFPAQSKYESVSRSNASKLNVSYDEI